MVFKYLLSMAFLQVLVWDKVYAKTCSYGNTTELFADCKFYATPTCRNKCAQLSYSPNYSCRTSVPSMPGCYVTCLCNYLNSEPTTPPPTTTYTFPTVTTITPPPIYQFNECLLFGKDCSTICKRPLDYCQVSTAFGPRSCLCRHWTGGNTMLAAFNDYIAVGEQLTSNNGCYRLKMMNNTHLLELGPKDELLFTFFVEDSRSTPNNTILVSGDRFVLLTTKTFRLANVTNYNGAALTAIVGFFSSLDGTSSIVLDDSGIIYFNGDNGVNIATLISTDLPTIKCPNGRDYHEDVKVGNVESVRMVGYENNNLNVEEPRNELDDVDRLILRGY